MGCAAAGAAAPRGIPSSSIVGLLHGESRMVRPEGVLFTNCSFSCCCLFVLQLASATVGLACYLVSNALVVSNLSCRGAAVRQAIYWLSFVRWSCWNTTFLVTTIKVGGRCLTCSVLCTPCMFNITVMYVW